MSEPVRRDPNAVPEGVGHGAPVRERRSPVLTPRRAMVLAAGLGTRLRPLTEHVPKPLVPLVGRPLLENVIVNLRAAGVREIGVNTHHLAEQVSGFVSGLADPAGIVLFHEPVILGTGGAFVNARDFLRRDPSFLHHNSDVLTDLDIGAVCEAHAGTRAVATLALTDHPSINNVACAEDGSIVDILGAGAREAPEGTSLLTYTSIGVFSREIFDFLPESGPCSLTAALLRAVRERPGSVRGFRAGKIYWNTVESLRGYRTVHEDVLVRKSIALRDLDTSGPAVRVSPGSAVSEGARFSGFVSVGAGCRVDAGAELEDCVLLPGAVVGAGERLRDAVVGKDFRIGLDPAREAERPLVKGRGFGPGVQVVPLVEQGSDRQFYRVSDGRRSEVLMVCQRADPDFDRYVGIGRFLHSRELGAPEILAVDEGERCLLLEDLGDETLYLAARPEHDESVLEGIYAKVIDLLVSLQARATPFLRECPLADERALDYGQLRWETAYFRDNFLGRLLGMGAARTAALDDELHALARAAAAGPQVFIHRDFQSQNILLKGGRARIVDFQGARHGPAAYDLASLLRDSYVVLPRPVRERLAERYRVSLASAGGPRMSPEELRRRLVSAGLQRNMQALGAFCYLWLVKNKPQFRRFIDAGLRHLEEGLVELEAAGEAPGPLPLLARAAAESRKGLPAALARAGEGLPSR